MTVNDDDLLINSDHSCFWIDPIEREPERLALAQPSRRAEKDQQRVAPSTSYEAVRLLGDAKTIRTTKVLNDTAHRLEGIARGWYDADSKEWDKRWQEYKQAADDFHRSVRQELAVPGLYLPGAGDPWVPPSLQSGWRGSPSVEHDPRSGP